MAEIMVRFNELRRYCENHHCGSVPLEYIKQMRTVEAEPVRHGRWKTKVIDTTFCYQCSACNSVYVGETTYCPHCGAKMNGGEDNANP